MSYYEKNVECLKMKHGNLFNGLNDVEKAETKNPVEKVWSETAINGEPILVIQKDGKSYRLNSSYDPTHEVAIWAEQFELNNLSNIIAMFGLGNALFSNELSKRLKKDDFFFIYEPSRDIFDYVMHHYDMTELLSKKNVILVVEGVNDFDFHILMQFVVNITNLYSQVQCIHPCYEELFTKSCITYWKEIRDTMIHTHINVNTEVRFGPIIIENSFHNLKYLRDSYTLEELCPYIRTDLPAIIVAAGPSVKENIEELKRAKGRAYIFAVDRILDYMLDLGVEPDFVVTVDPVKPVKYFSKRDNLTIPLFTELASNKDILDIHKGKKIIYNCDTYFKKIYEAAGKIAPSILTGSSVATVTFSVCNMLGFDKIVLVGQDLAYDGELTHAGGVAEGHHQNDVMVNGLDGEQVRSRYDWKEFIIWFKDMIFMYPHLTVFDTKKKGAKIEGAVLMSLSEVLENYGAKETHDFKQELCFDRATFDRDDFRKAIEFLKEGCEELEILRKKSKEAIKLCDQQIRAYKRNKEDTDVTIKNFKRISKINRQIEEKAAYSLVENLITTLSSDAISSLYKISEDERADKIETYRKSKNIYQAMISGVEYTQPKFQEMIKELDDQLHNWSENE